MKKILLALLTLMSVISYSQTTGHLRYDTVRIYKQGGNSNLVIENSTRDTLGFLYNYGDGRTRFEKVRAVPGGIKFGEDTIIVSGSQQDFLIGGSVTPEGGFRFSVQEADYGIEGIFYSSDSATVFVDSADATYDRFDVIYLDSDQTVKVLTGIPAENPAIPQLPSGTILLTVVSVEAGAIQANTTSINVYFENDATITPSGTTAVGNSTTAPYAGTFHIRITTINTGDYVDIIKTSGTWDISGQDFLSLHIKNRAQILQLQNLRVSLWNGSTTGSQVSGEVILNYNKNNITTYQAISIPMSAFQTITNTNIDRIRLRFTSNNATATTGYDLDNIFFGANLQQPGGGDVNSVDVSIDGTALSVSGPSTGAVNKAFTWEGNSTQYIRGDGTLATFSAVTTVGAFGSQASQANGLFISGLNIYGQPVTATEPGMTTPAMKASWDSSYYVTHIGNGIEYMVAVDAATTAFKTFVVTGSGFTTIDTDTTFGLNITGGGGSSLLPTTGTGIATGNVIGDMDGNSLTITDADALTLSSNVAGGTNFLQLNNGSDNLLLKSDIGSDESYLILFGDIFSMNSTSGLYQMTNLADDLAATKVMTYNGGVLGTQDISGLGGGGSSLFPTTGTGTATGDVVGDLDGNTLSINDGQVGIGMAAAFEANRIIQIQNGVDNVDLLHVDIAPGAEHSIIKSLNTQETDPSYAFFESQTTITHAQFEMQASFNGGVKTSSINSQATATTSNINYEADTHTFTGAVSIIDGTEQNGYVFTSDASGNGSWQAPGAGGSVSSVTGTANQITASPTTGAVALSIPSVFSAPGTITSASTLTVTSGGLTVTAGGALITAGGLTVTAGTTTLTPLNSIGLVVNSAAGVLSSYAATDHALQLGNATGQIASLGLGTAGQILTSNGAGFDPSWAAGGANTVLSNLASVAINTSLISDADNTDDLGSSANAWKDIYARRLLLDGATSGTPIIESDALGDVLLGTVLSGQGTIPVDYDIVTRADETLANSNSDQPMFTNTAHDVISVVANTTYDFEVRADFTHGAVSHNIEFGMIPTTATITSIEYNASGWVTAVGTNTASQNTLRAKSTATTQVIAAGANGTETLWVSGTFTVGATGGSIMPTIQFSADPTGTILLKTGARFKLTARGNDTFTQKGPIN